MIDYTNPDNPHFAKFKPDSPQEMAGQRNIDEAVKDAEIHQAEVFKSTVEILEKIESENSNNEPIFSSEVIKPDTENTEIKRFNTLGNVNSLSTLSKSGKNETLYVRHGIIKSEFKRAERYVAETETLLGVFMELDKFSREKDAEGLTPREFAEISLQEELIGPELSRIDKSGIITEFVSIFLDEAGPLQGEEYVEVADKILTVVFENTLSRYKSWAELVSRRKELTEQATKKISGSQAGTEIDRIKANLLDQQLG